MACDCDTGVYYFEWLVTPAFIISNGLWTRCLLFQTARDPGANWRPALMRGNTVNVYGVYVIGSRYVSAMGFELRTTDCSFKRWIFRIRRASVISKSACDKVRNNKQTLYLPHDQEVERLDQNDFNHWGLHFKRPSASLDCRPLLKISTTTAFTTLLNFCFPRGFWMSWPISKLDGLKSVRP